MNNAISALVERVEKALLEDPRTEDCDIDVVNEGGVIKLLGVVDSETTRLIAEEIASSQEGVIEVINDLEVEEDDFFLSDLEKGIVSQKMRTND